MIQSHLILKLSENLTALGISENDKKSVVDALQTDDLFRRSNINVLSTDKSLFIKTILSLWILSQSVLVKINLARKALLNIFLLRKA